MAPEKKKGKRGRKALRCPAKVATDLGTGTDQAIGDKHGYNNQQIRVWRLKAGIESYDSRGTRRPTKRGPHATFCPPEVYPYLGTDIDGAIGKKYGYSQNKIRIWRVRADIAPHARGFVHKPLATINKLHPGLFAKLGQMPDPLAGKPYGLSRERIRQYRDMLGIPSYASLLKAQTDALVLPLAHLPTTEIAKLTGLTASKVYTCLMYHDITPASHGSKYQKQMESIRHRMGKESDTTLGIELQVGNQVITRFRDLWGIAPVVKSVADRVVDRQAIADMYHHDMSDEEIAHVLECSTNTVIRARLEQGLSRKNPKGNIRIYRIPSKEEVLPLVEEGLSDATIALRLGTKSYHIATVRISMGVTRKTTYDWTDIDPLLGKQTDRSISLLFGIPSPTILNRRRNLGIQVYKAPPPPAPPIPDPPPTPDPVDPSVQCALEDCSNRCMANSKYCSLECRRKYARRRYKLKNR